MRSLPQEELAGPETKKLSVRTTKNNSSKKGRNPDVAGLIRDIESYADDDNPSAARTKKLIEATRYKLIQIHISHTKKPKNRHTAPNTKKRPDKYNTH